MEQSGEVVEKPDLIDNMNETVTTGSIYEKTFIDINGTKQGAFIKSRSADLPVLLLLHGGIPFYFLTAKHPTGLEELFTTVWWEQRGSGISYAAAEPATPITVDQLIEDTFALTEHLRRRFGQDKIYLMGHSGGTFLGLQAIQREPELFHAYIAVAQITNQLESEQLAYDYMLNRFREMGDKKWVKRLEATSVKNGTPPEYLRIRDVAMHRLGIGTMHQMRSLFTGLFLPSLMFPEYTLREKWNFWAAKARSGVSVAWETILSTDLRQSILKVEIPIYFMHGVHDYTCSYELARSYAAELRAPVKGFYSFYDSAHSPIFEEPEKARNIIRQDVFQVNAALADAL